MQKENEIFLNEESDVMTNRDTNFKVIGRFSQKSQYLI